MDDNGELWIATRLVVSQGPIRGRRYAPDWQDYPPLIGRAASHLFKGSGEKSKFSAGPKRKMDGEGSDDRRTPEISRYPRKNQGLQRQVMNIEERSPSRRSHPKTSLSSGSHSRRRSGMFTSDIITAFEFDDFELGDTSLMDATPF